MIGGDEARPIGSLVNCRSIEGHDSFLIVRSSVRLVNQSAGSTGCWVVSQVQDEVDGSSYNEQLPVETASARAGS